MNRTFVLALPIALIAQAASADGSGSSGAGALALAALVGAQSPSLDTQRKQALAEMLDGNLNFAANPPIIVAADSVSCRQSDVDISYHDCTLKFGVTTKSLSGRAAHELYATMIENGVPSDGAAGSIYEAVSHLSCTIKLRDVKQRAGGGATCAWGAGTVREKRG
ncbi:MAG TPA: hypothetical protein VKS78_05725 [Roseiarcus sp.]|nr:hypothetical protein [Roseiarcus sp.]